MADNSSDDGRAQNRHTELIGYKYPKPRPRPVEDPMKQVTTTLDNGFIITYRPGAVPDAWLANFQAGTGANFQLLTNTTQMRQYNLFNNTTNGEILSSVLIICGSGWNPCKLDSPILVRVPLPFSTKCPIEKVKFFNAVAERGKQIWQEQSKELFPEVINGRQYIRLWMDDFCQCINFDFKIDPECFDVDSTRLLLVHRNIKNLTTELAGLNSVYMPRKVNDSTHSILYVKDKLRDALVSFSLYKGKRWVKTFRNQPLATLPYQERSKSYIVQTDTIRFYLPKVRNCELALRVNKDRYRVAPENDRSEFVYLKRKEEVMSVDILLTNRKGHYLEYRKQPLSSIPYDTATGQYVIDRKFLKLLEQSTSLSRK